MSSAFHDNPASQRVSLAVGYEPDGMAITVRRREPAESHRFRLSRARWEATDRLAGVDVEGWTPACAAMFGV